MSLTRRLIARIDLKPSLGAVKGRRLDGLKRIGPVVELAAEYEDQGADELLLIDTTASLYGRPPAWDILREVAHVATIPVTYCGGIRSVPDALKAMRVGVEKVGVNSALMEQPRLLTELAYAVGSQAVVASLEVKRTPHGWRIYYLGGREPSQHLALEWAHETSRRGAGELLVTSVDGDGTRQGYDVDLMKVLRAVLPAQVMVASGGCSGAQDILRILEYADAAAVGTLLHDGTSLADLKAALAAEGVTVR